MRRLLFSVAAADCTWSYTKGTGAGGQKKNKTSSAVHCTHDASGAHGYSEETRSQAKNREIAFKKMAESQRFKDWHTLEVLRRTGVEKLIDAMVEQQMKLVKVEVQVDGRWETWHE